MLCFISIFVCLLCININALQCDNYNSSIIYQNDNDILLTFLTNKSITLPNELKYCSKCVNNSCYNINNCLNNIGSSLKIECLSRDIIYNLLDDNDIDIDTPPQTKRQYWIPLWIPITLVAVVCIAGCICVICCTCYWIKQERLEEKHEKEENQNYINAKETLGEGYINDNDNKNSNKNINKNDENMEGVTDESIKQIKHKTVKSLKYVKIVD